jgi:hypothetical protein
MRRRARWKVGIVMMVVAATAVASQPAGWGAARATGDPAAWAEVVAAFTKLSALPGYRVKVASPSEELTADRDVVPGKALHELIHDHQLTLETITVGGDSRHRLIVAGRAGAWRCDRKPHGLEPDPTTMQDTVRAARGAEAVIDGARVHVVTYSWDVLVAGKYVTRQTTVSVDPRTGLPRRSVSPLVRGEYILDYYDYGAKIKITLPICRS